MIINNPFELVLSISDSFVSPFLKLANGKGGHGERRLYSGDNNFNNEYICKKPWLINYHDNYKNDIHNIISNDSLFSKKCDHRKNIVFNSIDNCNNKFIIVSPQNGIKDVNRYYIGPNKNNKENIKLYDSFRSTIIPKLYSLKLTENSNYFECNIINNQFIKKKKKKF